MFKIKVLDTFINECQTNGNEISYENFGSINESYSIGEESVNIPQEIFESYMKYVDVTGTEMVTLNEFEKIKSFAEFIQDKEAEGGIETDDTTEEPAAEEASEAAEAEAEPAGEAAPEEAEEKPEPGPEPVPEEKEPEPVEEKKGKAAKGKAKEKKKKKKKKANK